ncbi:MULTISPECIES: type III secretion system chaperone [Bradyrhizobium]|uniref:type III secretion system chaperone n=1 Tax=Bradyrhizobium TaxID=374 RepID=UPI001BAD9A47|nr:type III secretion system chaperone [Bradyrhizobium liaoningense]MBR0988389.1 CesT family type III secretion system chaperone [Bradyrhizobium liaoningense]GMO22368.1 hypothetical protein TM233_30590 [Bradyrhizobium sp. TM233]GMP12298.1 hypothetical protein TM239_65160 [Bradyrhizobium sp. TM239]
MNDEFRRLIETLWHSLGLSPPRLRSGDEASLSVDGISITLALSHDERHVVISGPVGALSDDPLAMDEEIARLLKSNLRFLPYRRACCRIDNRSSPPAVRIEAIAPCLPDAMTRLVETIGDVAHMAVDYAAELGHPKAPRLAAPAPSQGHDETILIFRP